MWAGMNRIKIRTQWWALVQMSIDLQSPKIDEFTNYISAYQLL
jgi:hypothetical protein